MVKAESRGGACLTFTDGKWRHGSPKLLSPTDHAMWLSSVVFDGARAIRGGAPDLDKHAARAIRSCEVMGLQAGVTAEDIVRLARDGVARFPNDAELYICPLFYATDGFMVPEAASTRFVLTVQDAPLPEPKGFKSCRSNFRRPARDMAPTEAKASCLYPNIARDMADARARGFDNAVVLDPAGNVAEFSYSNLFMVKDGAVHTPVHNGTFLNGVTRQRVIKLLKGAGHEVNERTITYGELAKADELFGTGNYAKVLPCVQLDGRPLQPGPVFREARDLYMTFAAQS